MKDQPNIFEFLDLRAYLKQYYEQTKAANPGVVSYRYLSRRAGFSAPNYFQLIIKGKRTPSADALRQVASGFELNDEERKYLLLLGDLARAEDTETRLQIIEQLTSIHAFKKARTIDAALFEYLAHWYYPAVLELAAREDFRDEPEWVARRLRPKIDPSQAEQALDVLFELGLLRRDDGQIVRGSPRLATGPEVRAAGALAYHRQMIGLALTALDRVPSEEREYGGLTGAISPELVPLLKSRINEFRASLHDVFENSSEREVVYQLNIQLFPLSEADE